MIQKKTRPAIEELREFLAIPNDALNPSDIDKNVDWLEEAFSKRGFETQVLANEGLPLFFAESKVSDNASTVLFYMHFDGQSIDPSKWDQADPYVAVLKEASEDGWKQIEWSQADNEINPEWRIFGRSSSDDKGPIVMLLQAMDGLKELGLTPAVNIKVILDGEEEKGEPLSGRCS